MKQIKLPPLLKSSGAIRLAKIVAAVAAFAIAVHIILCILPYRQLDAFLTREYSTRVYDRKNHLIQVIPLNNGLRREYVPMTEIPRDVQKMFIKAEDKRFYFHPGIDLIAVIRSVFLNIQNKKNVSGASTITMQLAKVINQNYLNQNNEYLISVDRTMLKKVDEAFCALMLEAKFSKKQILELYLNSIPFGNNAEGVMSASRLYFGREIKDLTKDEIEILAKIPRRPSLYSPSKKYQYPFFMPHLVRYLKENNYFLAEKKSKSKIYKSKTPYRINLSVDFDVQVYAQTCADDAIKESEYSRIGNIAVLVLDVQTGKVLAWIGNHDFNDKEHHGEIDGVRFKNQPGSSIKPFLYALAIEKGIVKPTDVIADIPTELGENKAYIPSNFNNRFNGPVRLRVALASSLNIPAVKILDMTGIEVFAEHLEELGFSGIKENAKETGYALALGGGEVSLFEFVPAFSVFARDGQYIPISFLSGKDAGKEVKRESKMIYESDTARIIDSFLSDKSARSLGFGYYQTFETKYPSIFKTGTSNQFQNITALGATPRYAVGVWMGNFSGETVIGKTGSSLPAYVARKILDYLENYDDMESLKFPEPENYKKVKICPVSGNAPTENCKNTLTEYLKKGDSLKKCTWHVMDGNKIKTVYPAAYQQWYLINEKIYSDNHVMDYTDSTLKIVSPRDNSLYYYDPYSRFNQGIEIEVIGGEHDVVEIFIDEQIFEVTGRPCVVTAPLEPGIHYIRAVCGRESDSISFEVR
ncbi:MAG: transglycosylase domain-containing protein [Treponema sp.]|uniref:transglycosylase domain-containing protein n=1 Tax=Treponema sp. TaxID=166 RepID=UPI00298DB2BD|nr:transglycosylase domain-containing protein [Treponema sp.]MBR5932808.1 transglycosylase domain-containing protein [Treponema sp.]